MAVDANVLISALLGGRAATTLQNDEFTYVTTEQAIWEVKKYVSMISRETRFTEADVHAKLENLPVVTLHPRTYDHCIQQAEAYIGKRDSRDVHILALARALDVPLWSDDRDFEGIPGVTLLKTADMLARMHDAAS